MLTGDVPWAQLGHHATEFQIFQQIFTAYEGPPLPNSRSVTCDSFLGQVFSRDPEDRGSAAGLLQHPWVVAPIEAGTFLAGVEGKSGVALFEAQSLSVSVSSGAPTHAAAADTGTPAVVEAADLQSLAHDTQYVDVQLEAFPPHHYCVKCFYNESLVAAKEVHSAEGTATMLTGLVRDLELKGYAIPAAEMERLCVELLVTPLVTPHRSKVLGSFLEKRRRGQRSEVRNSVPHTP
jgi:hypothetical protein